MATTPNNRSKRSKAGTPGEYEDALDGEQQEEHTLDPKFLELVKEALCQEILDSAKKAACDAVDASMAKQSVAVATMLSKFDAQQDAKHQQHVAASIAASARTDRLEQEQKQLKKDIADMQRRLQIAESPDFATSQKIRDAVRARPPEEADPTIVRINTASPVSFKAITPIIRTITDKAKVDPTQLQLLGEPVGTRFTLRCNMESAVLASAAVNRVFDAVKKDGKWLEVKCPTPEGDVLVYMGRDEPDALRKPRVLAKRLYKELTKKYGEADFEFSKRAGAIYYKASYLLQGVWSDGAAKIRVHDQNAARLGFPTDELMAMVSALEPSASSSSTLPGWSLLCV